MIDKSIIAENLEYWYDDKKAVDDISFDVGRGEILGFLGPNGAGKSTTIKMLTGQLKPQKGKAVVLGMNIKSEPKKVQQQIGICYEKTNLYEQMSALENLSLFARIFDVKNFDGPTLLERVGLGDRVKDKVETLSKGLKQRLMIARALVSRPQILFLDEPTDGLDPVSAESIRNLILEEKEKGVTVFLTTHDMFEADKLADKVAFINNGRFAALDTPYNLKQTYGKRSIKVEIKLPSGELENRRIILDEASTGEEMKQLFENHQVVTAHSEEATLEDIFINITGRGLL